MINKIYEHLITKKKYNTLQLKYDVKCEELEKKIVELNTTKRIRKIEKDKYENAIREYMDQIKKLNEEIKELKKTKRIKNGGGK